VSLLLKVEEGKGREGKREEGKGEKRRRGGERGMGDASKYWGDRRP